MRHNTFYMLKHLRFDNSKDEILESGVILFSIPSPRYLLLLAVILVFSLAGGGVASENIDSADGKCSPEAWLKLESEYIQAFRAGDIGRLKVLKAKKSVLLQECNRPGLLGGTSSGSGTQRTGINPGMPPIVSGPGTQPVGAASGTQPTGTNPGIPPIVSGPGIQPVGAGSGTQPTGTDPATTPIVSGPGAQPTGSGPETQPIGTDPGTIPDKKSGDDSRQPSEALTAEEKARKEEWNKRQEFSERMIREQAALEEANSGPVVTVMRDFWDSIWNGGKPTPVAPLREPSFQDLLSNGDPLATRLQQIRDQVGDGVPTQQQLDEIRDLSRAAHQGQAASGVAIVRTNVAAADLAQAGEVVSQIGAGVGQAAAEYVLVNSGVPRPLANAATTAIYDGLQHYDKGVTAVLVHGTVSAVSSAAGNAVGGKISDKLGDAAETFGGRILQGGGGGLVSGALGSAGHTTADGKDIKAGDVVQGAVVSGMLGAAIKPVAGAIGDAIDPVSSSSAASSVADAVDDVKAPQVDASSSSSSAGSSVADAVDDIKIPQVDAPSSSGSAASSVLQVDAATAPALPNIRDDIGNAITGTVKPVVDSATSSSETAVAAPKTSSTRKRVKLPETLIAD